MGPMSNSFTYPPIEVLLWFIFFSFFLHIFLAFRWFQDKVIENDVESITHTSSTSRNCSCTDKVKQIGTQLDAAGPADRGIEDRACYRDTLYSFRPALEDEVGDFVSKGVRLCELDPLAGQRIVQCLDALVPDITAVTGAAMSGGVVRDSMNTAIVRPLLKSHL